MCFLLVGLLGSVVKHGLIGCLVSVDYNECYRLVCWVVWLSIVSLDG